MLKGGSLMMKRIAALLLLLVMMGTAAAAEVEASPVLNAAFSMLEAGNPFLVRYNELTGSGVEAVFELGAPYFFGGKHDYESYGEPHMYLRLPDYAKRKCWETTHFYRKNAEYLYGFDCSGFTQYIFAQSDISLPRTTTDQYKRGTYVEKSELQPGDLVFFANTYRKGISHVGIYIGDGNMIHASSSKGITIASLSSNYNQSHYYGARRII
jgi:cell wall-associated NlpC family hydrolase